MKWVTRKDAETAAKQGAAEALECSILHHHQLATCKLWEFNRKFMRKDREWKREENGFIHFKMSMGKHYCSLCKRYGCCSLKRCPLKKKRGTAECCKEWRKAVAFVAGHTYETFNFPAFQAAEMKLYERLVGCRKEVDNG